MLALQVPIPKNGQAHSNNLSAILLVFLPALFEILANSEQRNIL